MLSRTTNGVGPLSRRTFEQLRGLDAGSWFSADFSGTRIPSLQEAFEHVRGRVGRIYAEVKGYRELEDVDRMVRVAGDAGVIDDTVFISLNWTLLDRIRSQNPSLAIGYIVDESDRAEEALDKAEGDARALVDFRAGLLTSSPSLAERTLAGGSGLCVWTVDEPRDAARLLEMGVRRFTTNEVEALLSWRNGQI